MPRVVFTSHLRRFFPDLSTIDVEAATIADVVQAVNARHPGLADYIVDELGRVRKHVLITVGEEPIEDRRSLSDAVTAADTVHILQALSGG